MGSIYGPSSSTLNVVLYIVSINKGKIGFILEKIYNKRFSPPNASYGSILPQKGLKFQVTV